MTGITKLTVGKGRTREATDGKAWVREYYELEVAVDDAFDIEVTRANALGLIDGWLSKSNRIQEAVRQGVTEKVKEATKPTVKKAVSEKEFNPEDLMKHEWKGKKLGQGEYEKGSLSWGWDFRDNFKPETIKALEQDSLVIDKHEFVLSEKIVNVKKVEGD